MYVVCDVVYSKLQALPVFSLREMKLRQKIREKIRRFWGAAPRPTEDLSQNDHTLGIWELGLYRAVKEPGRCCFRFRRNGGHSFPHAKKWENIQIILGPLSKGVGS